jgi:hypothetical protein
MSEQGSAKVNTRTASPVTELINSARLLCEKANQATGKSSRTSPHPTRDGSFSRRNPPLTRRDWQWATILLRILGRRTANIAFCRLMAVVSER